MGKRYYCEFCHKSFPANPENRKKHNEGVVHLTNRAKYYAKYKGVWLSLYQRFLAILQNDLAG